MEYLYGLSVALFLTIALIPLLMRASSRLGLVDEPGPERKIHTTAMPRTGGLGIIIGVSLPLLFLLPLEGELLYMLTGSAIIVVFGLVDDRVALGYKWKLFGQSLAAIVVMSGGIVVHQFPFFGLSDAPVWLSYPVTFVFLVGVVNGVNFSDGLDGLAAGISIMALLLIFLLAVQVANFSLALISLTLVGGVLGFLRYNTFPANVFMGDAGSQFLGFITACLAIAVTQSETSPYSTMLPVLLLGIPIMDILQVVPVRAHKKLPLPGPDKEHFHHQLGKLGFRHTEVVALIYVLQAVLIAAAFWLRFESDLAVAMFYSFFVITILGALLFGNHHHWQFRARHRKAASIERRNRYFRRLGWYFHNSNRVIAAMLGLFFLVAGWLLDGHANWDSGIIEVGVLLAALALGFFLSRFDSSKSIFRMILYASSALFAYRIFDADLTPVRQYALIAFLAVQLVCLLLAIRMTRSQEFSLTTQDLLILLVVLLMPLLPGKVVGEFAIGGMALVIAVLMYTSEFLLSRTTRAVAVATACAIAGSVFVLIVGN